MAEDVGYDMEVQQGPLLARKAVEDSADLDITPMIDITFLLLIFFLVASVPDPSTSVQLPPARFGEGVSDRTTVMITISSPEDGKAQIYLGDGTGGSPEADDPDDPRALDDIITGYVEDQITQEGKTAVLIKAGKRVLHRDVNRVAAAVGRIEGEKVSLHLAVFEIQ